MQPPGRRKMSSLTMLPLIVLVFLSASANAAAALGIDFGTEYIKAAIAKPGSPIEIVLTKDSKRKESASLAFKPSRLQKTDEDAFPERLYGGDALALSARFPGDVYSNLKTLLGAAPHDQAAQRYSTRFPALQIEGIPRNDGLQTTGFRSRNSGKSEPFMVEELLAMELKNIKANAEAAVGKSNVVSDVVITYPAFYTAEEKRALELAADLAGFRVLGLISDGQAVGLNYATTRSFDSKKRDTIPEYHVVYDMGAGSTTATVLKFHGKIVKGIGKKNQTVQEVQVLGTGYDRTLGGDVLNDIIVRDMIAKLVENKKIKSLGVTDKELEKDGKTMARLWKDAEKVRQVLSANQQASASFEGLYDDEANFKYTLTRADFEKLTASTVSRIATPLNAALAMANLSLKEVSSVILHGGLTRTPFVQAELERAAGVAGKVKTNINADEAAAFGAAFKAAGLSPSFRVKDIRTADIAGTAYTMKWSNDGKERSQKIFVETSLIGAEKQVTIRANEDVQFRFYQHIVGTDESLPIVATNAVNLTKSLNELRNSHGCAAENITTVFTVRLSPVNGLPEIISGSVSCETQKAKDGGVMDNVKGMFGFGGKKDSQQPLNSEGVEETDPGRATPLPVDDTTSSAPVVDDATPTPAANPLSKSVAKNKPTTITVPVALTSSATGAGAPPSSALPLIHRRLTAFDDSDKNAYLRSEAFNALEAFTYRVRDYLEDDTFATFSTEKSRKELASQLAEAQDWLYGDGIDAKLQAFKDKLKGLKSLVDPVLHRRDESSKREDAVETLRNSLKNASGMMDMIKGVMEEAAKEASTKATSLASSVSGQASSESSAVTDDDLDDEEPYASTSRTGSSETEAPTLKPYQYTQEDYASIESIYNVVNAWLEPKLKAQEKLLPHEDPAFSVSDLQSKAKQVGSAVSDVVMKQIKMQTAPKPKTSKSAQKTKKSKTASSDADAPRSTSQTMIKDEL